MTSHDTFSRDSILEQVVDVFGNCPIMMGIYNRYFNKNIPYLVGRNRVVFFFNLFVVKLPFTYDGIADNDWEGSVSNANDYEDGNIRYGRTRLVYKREVPIVLMERIEHAQDEYIKECIGRRPDWVDWVDCGQVGFNRTGKLVAYDYGCR